MCRPTNVLQFSPGATHGSFPSLLSGCGGSGVEVKVLMVVVVTVAVQCVVSNISSRSNSISIIITSVNGRRNNTEPVYKCL